MSVLDYQSAMSPLLRFAGSADDDLKEMLPSGVQPTFMNRVRWAATYMKKAGLLEPPRRGFYRITERGKELVAEKTAKTYVKLPKQYPEFLEFQSLKGTRAGRTSHQSDLGLDLAGVTPSEAPESAHENLRDELAEELLDKLKKVTPAYSEKMVVELLVKMGHGGSRLDAGKAIGRSGDGGIDGII